MYNLLISSGTSFQVCLSGWAFSSPFEWEVILFVPQSCCKLPGLSGVLCCVVTSSVVNTMPAEFYKDAQILE